MLIRWRHSGHFICFQMRHSHGRNFASILFKIIDKKLCCLPMFAIENQQNRLITSGRKSGPRFQKIAFLVFEPVSEVPGSIPGLGKKIFNLNFSSCDREWFLLCEKHRKWLNILLTLWCSCFYLCFFFIFQLSKIQRKVNLHKKATSSQNEVKIDHFHFWEQVGKNSREIKMLLKNSSLSKYWPPTNHDFPFWVDWA